MFDRIEDAWSAVRAHPAFRAGAVWAGAGFVLLQVMDLVGLPTGAIRWTGVLLAVGFVLTTTALALHRRSAGAAFVAARIPQGRRLVAALAILLVLGSGAWWTGAKLMGRTVAPGAERIAVLPFSASGSSATLGEGVMDLLATSLDQAGGVRTVHPRTVMVRWAQRAGSAALLDLEGSLAVGRDVGAGSVLLGSVVHAGDRVRLTGELYTVAGERIGEARTEGSADSVLALVDDLAARMLREVWRSREPVPNLRLEAITTSSVEALGAYLRGERHYRASRWDSTVVAFQEAVALDSTFALAWLRLGEGYGWTKSHGHPDALAAARTAAALADRLPARDRAIVRAHLLHEEGAAAATDTLLAYVARYPDDAMGWYLLGDVRYHAAVIEGLTSEEQSAPIDSVIRLDPTLGAPLFHLLETALYETDSLDFEHRLAQYAAAGGDGTAMRAAGDVRFAPADSFVARFARAYPAVDVNRAHSLTWQLWATAPLHRPDMDPDLTLHALDAVRTASRPRVSAQALEAHRMAILVALGRLDAADGVATARGAGDFSSFQPYLDLAAAGAIPPERAVAALPPGLGMQGDWLRSMIALGAGDTETPRSLGLLEEDLVIPPDVPAFVGGGLMAMRGWALLIDGDTAGGEALVRRGLREAGYGPNAAPALGGILFNWAVHLTRDAATRAEGIRRLHALRVRGAPQYLVPAHAALAEAYEADGRLTDAARHHAEVVRLWEGADPAFQPRVEAARRALAGLAREGRRGSP